MNTNDKVTIIITRDELIDLMLLCAANFVKPKISGNWESIHNKLLKQMYENDKNKCKEVNMFTSKDFTDLKMYFDLAYEHIEEYNQYTNIPQEDAQRMNEIENILYEYIDKLPYTEESPE